ncbi:hypothetical protein FHW04_000761 [Pantoea sp. AN62]|uniref:hypothetical protein n=1 Tax=Pantoea TaxID=53335 RepID=UPI000FE14ABC|nr:MULTISPECIES: hypothetical protein [Pantoea]MBS6035225.1 hypothetical protein [Pantoea sp.]MCQ5471480.1 hypothetical protein [Pantoea brenneri]MDH1086541.1 hypothetical protein [Pantoea brenneri]MDH2125342.1 hypothetical protein [Pantoea brenneri]MDU4747969.1 hypothetical protein [Pantoea sp.]
MAKLICGLAAMAGVLTGAAFLSGAGVSYLEWYSMPATISKAVVTVATLAAFVKVFLFLISRFFTNPNSSKESKS